jgi:hypothetical protein
MTSLLGDGVTYGGYDDWIFQKMGRILLKKKYYLALKYEILYEIEKSKNEISIK